MQGNLVQHDPGQHDAGQHDAGQHNPGQHNPGQHKADDDDVDDIASAVLVASRVLVGVSARSLRELQGAVTVTQFRALVVIATRSDLTLTGLADVLGVNSSSALRTLDRLERAELARRADNPQDRREVHVQLTLTGRALVEQVTARRRKEITRIVAAMPRARRADLVLALRAFADAAGEPEPQAGDPADLGW